MAEQKPITDDDDEKDLLEQHGHPNAVAPDTKPEATDAKEEVSAEETAEKPEAPAETGGGDPDPGTDGAGEGNEVLTETAAETPKPPEPESAPAPDPFITAKAGIDTQIADLRAKKKAGEIDFDEANDQINDLVMKRQDLTDAHAQQTAAGVAYWAGFEDEHGVSAKMGKQVWKDVQKDMAAKGRTSSDALATEFEHRLEKLKSAKPKPAPKGVVVKPPTSAPLPKGTVKVAPTPAHKETVPAKTEKSDEDELLEHVRKIPGGLRG